EEGNRHAPVALAGDTPVRTAGDHAVQTGLPPGWNELGLLDGIQRAGAQGAAVFGDLVHADEPLGGGPVDQWGLVAPAVHVAVLDGFVLEQHADFVELGDDVRVGLPDELAAEERQVADVDAVALYRVENVVVLHAVRLAGTEVVLTIGGRGVNDTRPGAGLHIFGQVDWREALVEGVTDAEGGLSRGGRGVNDTRPGAGLHIFGQVDWREALVEGVTEADVLQRPALATGDDGALQAVTLQAGLDQLLGQHQLLLAGVDQGIDEIGVDVQRLVEIGRASCRERE